MDTPVQTPIFGEGRKLHGYQVSNYVRSPPRFPRLDIPWEAVHARAGVGHG